MLNKSTQHPPNGLPLVE